MAYRTWLLFLTLSLAAVLTPGPAMLAILGHALARGGRATMPVVLGNGFGAVLLIGASVAGLATLLAAVPHALEAARWAGVAVLCWLGVRSFRRGSSLDEGEVPARNGFIRGGLIALSNPKALLFYSAVLPQFVDPDRAALPQFAVMAATFACLEVATTAGVSWAAQVTAPLLRQRAMIRTLNWAGGAIMIGAAALVAFARVQR
jgi:homoserine/homoserine lactone efflux protein